MSLRLSVRNRYFGRVSVGVWRGGKNGDGVSVGAAVGGSGEVVAVGVRVEKPNVGMDVGVPEPAVGVKKNVAVKGDAGGSGLAVLVMVAVIEAAGVSVVVGVSEAVGLLVGAGVGEGMLPAVKVCSADSRLVPGVNG
jgi:hypothetical protein